MDFFLTKLHTALSNIQETVSSALNAGNRSYASAASLQPYGKRNIFRRDELAPEKIQIQHRMEEIFYKKLHKHFPPKLEDFYNPLCFHLSLQISPKIVRPENSSFTKLRCVGLSLMF